MSYVKMFAREYTVQYADICLRMASTHLKDLLPVASKTFSWFPEQGNEVLCQRAEDWQASLKEIGERYQNQEDQDRFLVAFHEYGHKYVALAKELGSLKFAEMTNESLREAYERYFSIWISYTGYLWVSFVFNDILAEKGQHILAGKSISDKRAHDILTILFSPSKKGGIWQLQEYLLQFKEKGLKELPPEVVERIVADYAWMPCLDLQNDPWDGGHLQLFYAQLTAPDVSPLSFAQAAEELHLTPEEKRLFSNIKELAYVKDMRDVYRRQGVYAVLPFFDELGRRFKLSRSQVAYYTHDELVAALNGSFRLSANEIQNRKAGFLLQWKGEEIVLSTKAADIEAFKKNFSEDADQEIKGVVASRGVVRGKVKIVRGVQDLVKVEVGDILVAITTHPDFVPAMQRAAAFVTDEGGLTSHAAIVSREMKKPCLVGTKTGTNMLQDGDLVEVDANQGIVRLLKT